ncbi:MAG: BF3164 family lipoprotein [Balneola sp.]
MNIYVFYTLFALIILLGCDNKKVVEFKSKKYLTSKTVTEIEILSSGNVYISVVDTFLVVVKSDEPFIELYSTNSHKLLLSFGKEGRGPNEFLGPSLIKNRSVSVGKNIFFVHDYKRNKIARIEIGEVLKDSQNFEILPIPKTDHHMTFVHYISDRYIIGTPSQGGIMTILDLMNGESNLVPYLPELEFNVPEFSLPTIFRPAVLVNKKKNRIVVAPLYLGEMSFFNFKGELINSVAFEPRNKYEEELIQGEQAFSEIKEQIIELELVDDYIYALNSNTSVKNFRSNQRQNKIQVFNWNGNPIKEYILEQEHIFSMSVDPIQKRIYGYNMSAKTHNIVYGSRQLKVI